MSIAIWVALFVANVLFWLWVIRWGGAEWLEGRAAAGCLISVFAPQWSADGIGYVQLYCDDDWSVRDSGHKWHDHGDARCNDSIEFSSGDG